MQNNVKREDELYGPMKEWLEDYLSDEFKGASIVTLDVHSKKLDSVLEENGVLDLYPQICGLDIQIDVLGIIKRKGKADLVFVEAKKTALNIHDLGQLWAYCRLCDPKQAYLLSSSGLGSLDKILNNFSREDMLNFGDGKLIKKMCVGKWDVNTNNVDFSTMIPKI